MEEIKDHRRQNEKIYKRIAFLDGRISDLEQYTRINEVVVTGLVTGQKTYDRVTAAEWGPTKARPLHTRATGTCFP